MADIPNIRVLGVKVADINQDLAISQISKLAKDKAGHHQVVTVNSEFVMLAGKDPKFGQILEKADLAVADGQWVVWAKLIMGGTAQTRVTGVDLVDNLCRESAKKAITVGFLGGFGNVAEAVSKRQKAKFPGLKVAFAGSGDSAIGQDLRLNRPIFGKKRIDILFVAYGMGKQEFFIAKNIKNLNIGVAIGVGGAFDYISSVKRRAPQFMQKLGIEWLWRLMAQPSRAGRMLAVFPLFWILVCWQKLQRAPKNSKFW